jgi:hypothetical protein
MTENRLTHKNSDSSGCHGSPATSSLRLPQSQAGEKVRGRADGLQLLLEKPAVVVNIGKAIASHGV